MRHDSLKTVQFGMNLDEAELRILVQVNKNGKYYKHLHKFQRLLEFLKYRKVQFQPIPFSIKPVNLKFKKNKKATKL